MLSPPLCAWCTCVCNIHWTTQLREVVRTVQQAAFTYNICSAANVSVGDREHIHFYILNNLQETTRNIPPPYDHFVYYKQLKIGVSSQNEPDDGWKCKELSYTIKNRGYFPVIIAPPPQPPANTSIRYWYQANIKQTTINTTSLTPCKTNSNQSLTTCYPTSHLPLKMSCVVARIIAMNTESECAAEDLYVNINIQYHDWKPGLPLFLVAGAVCVVASVIPCTILYRYRLKKQVMKFPSDFINSVHVSTKV